MLRLDIAVVVGALAESPGNIILLILRGVYIKQTSRFVSTKYMQAQFFSVEEANALLSDIEPLMAELQERREKVIESRQAIAGLLENERGDFGGATASSLANEFLAIERLARKIRSHGCIIKDLNNGLVDFLSTREGREIYLCWQYGEQRITHYHELHSGFQGRQRL